MSDLTPERRAELRGLAESARPVIRYGGTDPAAVYVPAAELTALLDAADELDRIKAELGDPSRHYIMDGWLVIDTGRHTCGTGPGGHYGAHEPGCGLEQALRLDNLQGYPGDERDRLLRTVSELTDNLIDAGYSEAELGAERAALAATVERVRALADNWERLDREFLAAGAAGMSMPAVDAVRQLRELLSALDGADDGTWWDQEPDLDHLGWQS